MTTIHEVLHDWRSLRRSELLDPEIWTPLEESQASRTIDARSQASARVFTQSAGRKVVLESYLERKIQIILAARRDVISIEEQPQPVAFIDAEGKWRHHVFDFRVVLSNGSRIAVDVKVGGKVNARFRSDLACIANQADGSFAEAAVLLTEEEAPQASVADALLIASVKQDRDYEAYAKLADSLNAIPGPMPIRDLGALLDRSTSGFRAVVRLIAEGFLVRVTRAPLSPDTLVHPAALICSAQEAA